VVANDPIGTESNPTMVMPAEFLKLVDENAVISKDAPAVPKNETGPEPSTHLPLPPTETVVENKNISTTATEAPLIDDKADKETKLSEPMEEASTEPPATTEPTATNENSAKQQFPSLDGALAPSKLKSNDSTRKKRHSFFGKIREVFHHKDRKSSNPIA